MSQPDTIARPNQYILSGAHTQITYSSTSFAGKPQIHYQDAHHNVSASGADIHTAETEIGTQITILIEVTTIHNRRLTLLIPMINLHGQETETALQTIAILTTTQTEGLAPVRESYHALALHGTARLVDF
jgi:hypothetical protein